MITDKIKMLYGADATTTAQGNVIKNDGDRLLVFTKTGGSFTIDDYESYDIFTYNDIEIIKVKKYGYGYFRYMYINTEKNTYLDIDYNFRNLSNFINDGVMYEIDTIGSDEVHIADFENMRVYDIDYNTTGAMIINKAVISRDTIEIVCSMFWNTQQKESKISINRYTGYIESEGKNKVTNA